MAKTSVRMSAEERRESVIRASLVEFAERGYHGTSTQAIATRVGVSQPYLFRLFPSKRALFEAVVRRCMDDVRDTFLKAAEGLEGQQAREAMGLAYVELITDRTRLLMQMQMYVSTFAAESAGDAEVGEAVRAMWVELWDAVSTAAGMTPEEATGFFAHGMLINALVAMGFPPEHRLWQGFGDAPGC
ncbi:TetR/AcrR family transcriptional regulator [Streptacidiphilus carbonis]|uniref:TetR/AcrR family transcriptional regulator n=1 Tax=Streptacidiphilus carbonis TaxID=105422 RepID=UPI001F1E2DC9|nr:TetR/AcrR family transcriptional regulator [Streptacidiphilus carbonis]